MNKTDQYTVVSLFTGLGGLDLGFVDEGFKVVWANEVSVNAVESYRLNFGNQPICGDIEKIPLSSIPRADVVIGGPPCQSFSLVGLRRPNDDRGRLVFRFTDVVRHLRPKVFVMENVPGILASHVNGTRLVDVLASKFANMGYVVQRWHLLASDYLVPQRRRRFFLIGSKQGDILEPDPINYAADCFGIDQPTFDLSAAGAIGDLGPCVPKGCLAKYRCEPHTIFSRLMRIRGNNHVTLHECPRMSSTDLRLLSHIPPGGNYTDVPDYAATGRILKFKETGGRTTTYGRLHPNRPSYTINTYFRRPNVGCNFHYSENRLITPREAMRFQSIPDDFRVVFDSQDERNAFIGNLVPPLMARAVAWSIRNHLQKTLVKRSSQKSLV